MGTDLLSDIRREIDERLRALRPALKEYEQLLEAADALEREGLDGDDAPSQRRTAGVRATGASKRRSSASNVEREAIAGALEHGSHTVGELVVVTALSAARINGNLRKLAAEGVIAKTEREGKTAWSLTKTD